MNLFNLWIINEANSTTRSKLIQFVSCCLFFVFSHLEAVPWQLPHESYGVENTNTSNNRNIQHQIGSTYLIVAIIYLVRKKSDPYLQIREETVTRYRQEGTDKRLIEEARKQLTNKYLFFSKPINNSKLQKEAKRLADNVFHEEVTKKEEEVMRARGVNKVTYGGTFKMLISHPFFLSLAQL